MAVNPLSAPSYIAGTIAISGGLASSPQNLMALIQSQLEPNYNGTGSEALIQSVDVDLHVGKANTIGALSATNRGYDLLAGGASRTYRLIGSMTVGSLWVFCAAGSFNVEIIG